MRALTLAALVFIGLAAAAIAYPPAKVSKGSHYIKLGGLDCGRKYKVRISERQGDKWADAETIKRQTSACAPPPPQDCQQGGKHVRKLATVAAVGVTATLAGCYPNPSTTGTPQGWVPQSTTSSDVTLSTAGQVYHDVRLTNGADITVRAPNVTIRNVELNGGYINNDPGGSPCGNGMVLDHVTLNGPKDTPLSYQEGHVSYGGYTARYVEMNGVDEGFRVSSVGDCGPVTIENSFLKIVPPSGCGDWHGDGIQSWYGDAVTVRNTTIDMRTSGCYGTAPFFRPSGQGNQGCATIDGLLVMGQGFPFRLGTCGTVKGLQIVDGSWVFGPIDVKCSIISSWDAQIVTITSNYGLNSVVRQQPCNTEGGG